jgi:hypothetical protein
VGEVDHEAVIADRAAGDPVPAALDGELKGVLASEGDRSGDLLGVLGLDDQQRAPVDHPVPNAARAVVCGVRTRHQWRADLPLQRVKCGRFHGFPLPVLIILSQLSRRVAHADGVPTWHGNRPFLDRRANRPVPGCRGLSWSVVECQGGRVARRATPRQPDTLRPRHRSPRFTLSQRDFRLDRDVAAEETQGDGAADLHASQEAL